eukprot:Amastigsp_a359692_4.p4 type:complete len:103 gc:universal Amastigsp_a359692_4:151-459(+)
MLWTSGGITFPSTEMVLDGRPLPCDGCGRTRTCTTPQPTYCHVLVCLSSSRCLLDSTISVKSASTASSVDASARTSLESWVNNGARYCRTIPSCSLDPDAAA